MQSNLDAATQAATFVKELLWAGSEVVSVLVPKEARCEAAETVGETSYIWFQQNIKGGRIRLHLLDVGPEFIGTRVSATLSTFRLTEGEKSDLFVELRLAPGMTPTHRLSIMSAGRDEVVKGEGFRIFPALAPLVGVIVLAPIASKVRLKEPLSLVSTPPRAATVVAVAAKKPRASKVVRKRTVKAAPASSAAVAIAKPKLAVVAAPVLAIVPRKVEVIASKVPEVAPPKKAALAEHRDRALEQYLAGGWQIGSQDRHTVQLWKMKAGDRKTITHHRPRPVYL